MPGKIYEYAYESNTRTTIPGSTEEHAGLQMRATVKLAVASPCEMEVKLANVQLLDSDPAAFARMQPVEGSATFRRALERAPLRVAFIDGLIEAVCPAADEPVWVLNIKRGIISALQNSMDSLHQGVVTREVDVTGDCPVTYEVIAEGHIKKVKDILACTYRHGVNAVFQGTPYESNSNVQSAPLMKTTHECEQRVNADGVIAESACTEMHIFRPFSRKHSGAMTEVNYKLTLRAVKTGTIRMVRPDRRASMLFQHAATSGDMSASVEAARQTMAALCAQFEDIRPDTPALFTRLVEELRVLDATNLAHFAGVVATGTPCAQAEKILRDAMPIINTEASVALISKMVVAGNAMETEADIWLTSLAFIGKPSLPMLVSVSPLLEMPGPASQKAMVAVTSLVNNYCRLDSQCADQAELQHIIRVLVEMLKYNCKPTEQQDHDHMMLALKALANAGHAEKYVATLNRCMRNEDAGLDVRVAAINVMQRLSCAADRSKLMHLLKDMSADAELRINAYLAIMKCPDVETIAAISDVLENEEINQVGSFIWTHLSNLKESSAPLKQAIRAVLEDIQLKKAFDLDKRKFSRNMEWSFFNPLVNAGAAVESNVIFSTDSFIPRSAMVSLDVDVFGETMNLMQVGGRVEGLETMLEAMLGPSSNDIAARRKRSLVNNNHLNALNRRFSARTVKGMKASYEMKLFGNLMRYGVVDSADIGAAKSKLNYLDLLLWLANDKSIDFRKNIKFLDASFTIPTAIGMPLRMRVEGTASMQLKIDGKADLRQVMTKPRSIDINGVIKPSAAVDVIGTMSMDAFVSQAGLKLATTLHTSTQAAGLIQLRQGKIFNMDINMPKGNIEILSVESKFYMLQHGVEHVPAMLATADQIELSKCAKSAILGVEACAEIAFPRPFANSAAAWFPFSGPALAKFYIDKIDTHRGFHVEAKYVQDKGRRDGKMMILADMAKISLDMPGSRADRELTAEVTVNHAEPGVKLTLRSPWKKLDVAGALVNTDQLKKVDMKAIIDQHATYALTASAQIEARKYGKQITPHLEVIIPNKRPITLDGTVFYRGTKKVQIDLNLQNALVDPISVKGELEHIDEKKYQKVSGKVEVDSALLEGACNGYVTLAKKADLSFSSRLNTEYTYRSGPKQQIVLTNKVRYRATKNLKHYFASSSITTTLLPRYNGDFTFESTVGPSSVDTSLVAGFDSIRKIIMSETVAYNFSPKAGKKTLTAKAKFDLPYKNWHYEANVEHQQQANKIESNASLKYGKDEAVGTLLLARESVKPLRTHVSASLRYPGREMGLEQTIREKPARQYNHMMTVKLDKYQKATVGAVLTLGAPHKLTVDVQLPDMRPIHAEGLINPVLEHFAGAAQVTYAANRHYAVAANLNTKGKIADKFNADGNFDLTIPARQVKLVGSVSRDGNEYGGTLKTQLNAADAHTVTVTAALTASAQTPKLAVRVLLPGNDFVDIKANGNYPAQGAYSAYGETSGAVAVTSSYPGFEAVGASFKYSGAGEDVKASSEFSWAKGKKVNAELIATIAAAANIDGTLVVRTPFAGFRSSRLEVAYKLLRDNLEATAKAQWERQAVELKVNGIVARRMIKGDIALTTPWRYYEDLQAKIDWSYNGPIVNAMVDASWAHNQAIRTALVLNIPGGISNVNGKLTVATPFYGYENTEVNARHKFDGVKSEGMAEAIFAKGKRMRVTGTVNMAGGWSNTAADFTIITPFVNMQQMAAKLRHNYNRQAINTAVEASWGRGQKVSVVLAVNMPNWPAVADAKITVVTPFANYEVSSLEANYKLGARDLSAALNGEFYGKKALLTLAGEANSITRVYGTEARLKSSFHAARDIYVSLKRAARGMHHTIDAEVGWAPRQRIVVSMNMNHALTGLALTNNGQISITTPFQASRNMLFKWNHDNDANMVKSSTEFHRNGLPQMSTSVDASHVVSTRRREFNANVVFNAPAYDIDDVSLAFAHRHNRRSLRNIRTEGSLRWGRNKAITYSHEMDLVPNESVIGNAKFTSPFAGLEDISMNINSRKHKGGLSIHKQLRWANKKIALDGDVGINGDVIASNMRFTSPFTAVRRLLLNVDKRQAGDQTKVHVDFEYARGSKIDVNAQWALWGADKLIGFNIVSPIPYMRSVGAEVSLAGDLRDFKFATQVAHDMMGGKITLEVAADTENVADISTRIVLSTPFDAVSYVEASVTHKRQGAYRFLSAAMFQCPSFEVAVKHDLVARSAQSFTTQSTIEYGRGQKIEIVAAYQQADSISAKFELHTPFAKAKDLVLTIKHDGPANNFKTDVELSYAPGKTIAVGAEFALTRGPNVRAIARLTSLCPYARRLVLAVNHNGPATNFKNDITLEMNDKRFSSENEFTLGRGAVKVVMHVTTPYTGYDVMHLEITHSGGKANLRTAVSLAYPTGTITANCHLAIADKDISGTIDVTTPYAKARKLSIKFSHSAKRWSNFENAASVTLNGQKFAALSYFKWVGNTLRGKVVANVPLEYSIKMNHRGPMTNFNTKGSIVTPIAGYERFNVDLDHKGDIGNFRSGAKLDSAMLDSPAVVNVNHRGGLLDFESGVTAEHGGSKMGVAAAYRHVGASTTGSVRLQTPYEGLKSLGAAITHKGDWRNFEANMAVNTTMSGYDQFSADLKHETTNRGIKTSLALRTPINKYERFNGELSHHANRNGFATTAAVTTPVPGYRRFGFNVNHNGDLGNFQSSAVVNMPFDRLRTLRANVNHRGHLRDFSSGAAVNYDDQKVQANVMFKQAGENVDASITLKTPMPQLSDLTLTASHAAIANAKTGKFEAIINQVKTAELDYSYTVGQRAEVSMSLRRPQPMEASVAINYATADKQIEGTFNWNTASRSSKVRVAAGFKNEVHYRGVDREARVKVVLPTREVGMLLAYTQSYNQFKHKADLQWDHSAATKLSYDVAMSRSSRRGEDIVDAAFNVRSAIVNVESTLSHRAAAGRMYVTEVAVKTEQKLTVRNELIFTHPSFKNTLTVKHPMFSRDTVVALDGVVNAQAVEVKAAIECERENIELSARVADVSRYANTHYSAQVRLTHPNSKLDVQLDAEAVNNQQTVAASCSLKYMMSRDARFRVAAVRAAIDKIRKEIELKAETPAGDMSLNVRMTIADNDVHSITMAARAGAMSVNGEAAIDLAKRSVEVTMHSSDANTLAMYAKYIDAANVKMEIYRQQNGRRIRDALITVGADGKNKLGGRTYIRPGILRDLKAVIGRVDVSTPAMAIYRQFVRAAKQDLAMKSQLMARAAIPLYAAAKFIADDVSQKVAHLQQAAARAVRNNEFYLNDAYQAGARTCAVIMKNADVAVAKMAAQWAIAKLSMNAAVNHANEAVGAAMEAAQEGWEQAQALAADLYDQVAVFMLTYRPYMENAGEQVAQIIRVYLGKVAEIVGALQMHPQVKAAMAWVLSLDPMDAIRPISRAYSVCHDIYMTVVDVYSKLLDEAFNVIEEIRYRPEVQAIITWVEDVIANTQWAVDYFKLKEKAMAWASELSANGMEMVRDRLSEALGMAQSGFTMWDPAIGDFGYSLTLPFRMVDLQSMPQLSIDMAKHMAELKNYVSSQIPLAPAGADWTMADIYYMYKPSADIISWVPPFSAHASIAGDQHFMTFDKRFFEFAGECSYLLARDFIDGNFSIVVNYARARDHVVRKSITVLSGAAQFEITPDGRVNMNGERIELPVEAGNMAIRRRGNVITIENSKGVTVLCDLPHNRCSVQVSGWYYGKTAGLLGTYDNEPYTDMLTANNVMAPDFAQLADGWTVGQRCRVANLAQQVAAEPTNRRYRLCAKYFVDAASPFRPCLLLVDPKPFFTMCLNDMKINVNRIESDEDVCDVSSMYVSECRRQGVPLRLPAVCSKCAKPDGYFLPGEEVTLRGKRVPAAADIIIVMQHAACNKRIHEKLKDTIDDLEKALKARGLKSINYGIVGYGGPGVFDSVHSHTIDGQLMNTRDKVLLGLDQWTMEAGDNDDSMMAVRFAANYPFRTGASKNILLLPCDACQEDAVTYADMQRLLLAKDIRLHVLMQQDIRLRSKSPKQSFIFGADRNAIFTRKHVKNLKGDQVLRKQAMMPKDLCVALSEETGGSLFNTIKWLSGKRNSQKRFVDVMVRVIAKKATPTSCQICECVPDMTGTGMAVCRDCKTPAPIYNLLPNFDDVNFTGALPAYKRGGRRSNKKRPKNKKRRSSEA